MPTLRSIKRGYFYSHVVFLYSLTFLVVLPLLCNRLKFSIYYGLISPRNATEETHNLREENDVRLLLARQHLGFASNTNQTSYNTKLYALPKNLTDVVITVITVSRKTKLSGLKAYDPRYLTQTVSKLIKLLGNDSSLQYFSYGLMICNVDNFPEEYQESEELSNLVHTVVKYKHGPQLQIDRFEKEKRDYMYCLEESLVYQPSYVLLIEVDAYPSDRMLSVLEYGIQNIFEGSISEFSRPQNKIAYLKLYHPERLLTFISSEFYRLFELAAAVLMLLTIFIVVAHRKGDGHLGTSCRVLTVGGVYLFLVALAIGRQNLVGIREISKHLHSFVPGPSCCTPANLYSYTGAVAMIGSFAHKVSYSGHAKDMLLDEFLKESGYKAIYVEPNIFRHIGQFSSLRIGTLLDPYVV